MGNFLKKITEHFKLKKERRELMKDFISIDKDLNLHPKMFDENVPIINCLYVDDDGIDFKKGDKK